MIRHKERSLDGPAAIVALRAINPKIRIIGTSGLDVPNNGLKAENTGVDFFIPKPYTTELLLHALQKVMASKTAR